MNTNPKKGKKNPLFIVTGNGKDVEEANHLFDAFIKKLGLGPLLLVLEEIVEILFSQVRSYAVFMVAKNFLDDFILILEKLIKVIDPVAAFSLFKR